MPLRKERGRGVLQVGTSAVDITPEAGGDLQGYLRLKPSEGIYAGLFAKAAVFTAAGKTAVLITSDLIGVSPDFTASVRRAIAARTGIRPADIMVTASHTHCGPCTLTNLISRLGRDRVYLARLKGQLTELVVRAAADLEPATLGTGSGAAHFNINRRKKTPRGVVMAPNPRGVCDREVGVIRIDTAAKDPKAIIVNFTCHPTVWGGLLISPDYPGFAQRAVESAYHGRTKAFFTNGACGDVRPNLTDGHGSFKSKRSDVRRLGAGLGREVLRVAAAIRSEPVSEVGAVSTRVRLPLQRPLTLPRLHSFIRARQSEIKNWRKDPKQALMLKSAQIDLEWARRTERLVVSGKFRPWVEVEVQILKIGDLCLVGLPGEILCGIGLAVKRLFHPAKALVVGYANDCVGYIPTAQAVREGGYEGLDSHRSFSLPAPFSSEVERVLVQTVGHLRDRLLTTRLT